MTKINQDNQVFLVIDDHELILESTINALKKDFFQTEILSAKDVETANNYLQNYSPNLVILDLAIPDSYSRICKPKPEVGLELLEEIIKKNSNINIVVLSSFPEALIRLKSKIEEHHLGGFTIAMKSSINDLIEKVHWSLQGITHTKNVPELRTGDLKPEWFQVLEFAFADALEDKHIAQKMHVSLRTVRNYWEKIYDVLEVYPEEGVNRRIATERKARELGFID